jgi:glycosyltransferase involved in cell wall biosynthesis
MKIACVVLTLQSLHEMRNPIMEPRPNRRYLISVIIPAKNEMDSLEDLGVVLEFLNKQALIDKKFRFEFLVIDNASTDQTWQVLNTLFGKKKHIRLLRNTLDLGLQRSILKGLIACKGDAAVVLQSDMQDPPELILKMIDSWLHGASYVSTKIVKRNSSFLDRWTRTLAYIFLNFLAGVKIESNSGDFWLIDRSIIQQLVFNTSLRPFFRTAIPRIMPPNELLEYERNPRLRGKSNFNFIGKYEFFLDALLSDARKFSMLMFMTALTIFSVSVVDLIIALPILLSNPAERIHHFAFIFCVLGVVGFVVSLILFPITLITEYIQRIYSDQANLVSEKTHLEEVRGN